MRVFSRTYVCMSHLQLNDKERQAVAATAAAAERGAYKRKIQEPQKCQHKNKVNSLRETHRRKPTKAAQQQRQQTTKAEKRESARGRESKAVYACVAANSNWLRRTSVDVSRDCDVNCDCCLHNVRPTKTTTTTAAACIFLLLIFLSSSASFLFDSN